MQNKNKATAQIVLFSATGTWVKFCIIVDLA
jgi:hypothetical protein